MEIGDLINASNKKENFFNMSDQKNGIKNGIVTLIIEMGAIRHCDIENIDHQKLTEIDESPHSVTIIEVEPTCNHRIESTYKHNCITTIFDQSSGYYFIFTKSRIIYFKVAYNEKELKTTKKSKRKPIKMNECIIPINMYDSMNITNVSFILYI
jgi:hypothetical protein